jgi:uncharacterized membrane protein YgdD (TMEM256/DUF423 family)
MHTNYIKTAAFLGALSVALGAFAAHKLKTLVPEATVATFETGVRYMFYHAFALLAVGMLFQQFPSKLLTTAGKLFIVGIVLFSGSLFILTLKDIVHIEALKFAGPVTPLGGLCFMAGWVYLALGIKK